MFAYRWMGAGAMAAAAMLGAATAGCGGGISAGGQCTDTVEADSDDALQAAASEASPGTCILLAPGVYASVSLPGGVSLSGESVDLVHIDGVVLGAGKGAVLFGLTVGAGGVEVDGATEAKIDSVHVSGSAAAGIVVAPGSSVQIISSEIDRSGTYGVAALDADDATSVSLEQTTISASAAGGVWMTCKAACGCGAMLDVSQSILRDNLIVGAAASGATVSLEDVDILRTAAGGPDYLTGQFGGGLSIAACGSVFAKGLRVLDSASFGVLVDGAAAMLGDEGPGEGIEVSRNVVGLWIQHAKGAQSGHVYNATFDSNYGVGIGVSGDSHEWIFCKTKISGTYAQELPVTNGAKEVGDGFDWLDGSEVTLEDVTLSGNARASIVIDGSADGSLTNVTLSGGDEQKGIVQQQFPMNGAQPTETNAPPITTDPGEVYAVPLPPTFMASP